MRPLLLLMALVACGEAEPPPLFGPPTGTSCPPASTLTYANFGQSFMARYCVRCHSSDLEGEARHGAPSFHDFDTQFGVRGVANHIDETTAAGPDAMNTSMPPDSPRPTEAERFQLGEWLACDAP
jgi:hypothetical protein